MVIDKPQKVEIQKIDNMVVLIWPGDLMLNIRIESKSVYAIRLQDFILQRTRMQLYFTVKQKRRALYHSILLSLSLSFPPLTMDSKVFRSLSLFLCTFVKFLIHVCKLRSFEILSLMNGVVLEWQTKPNSH